MNITHVKLTNWKNFVKVDVNLQQRAFIVGPNASGKSNFLDAFRFLHDIAKQGGSLQRAINDRGGLTKLRCLAARKNPNVEIEVTIKDDKTNTNWKYYLSLFQERRGTHRHLVKKEIVWKNDKIILNRPNQADQKDSDVLTQTYLEQISTNKDFRQIVEFFSETTYFHLIPQLVKFPQAFTGPSMPEDPYGKKFLEKIAKANKNHRNSWLKKITDALRVAIPQLESLKYNPDNLGIPHLEASYSHWRLHLATQNESQFSDGTLRLIALLWSLLEGKHLLLLEEPELSLHSAIVAQLPAIIYKLQKVRGRQVFISTHSYELLNDKGIALNEILLLIPKKEETSLEVASQRFSINQLLEGSLSPADVVIPNTRPANIDQLTLGF